MMLERIKTLLNIEDGLQDAVLNIIIENVSSHLVGLLGGTIPIELNYIIVEIAVRRYNRLGTEGAKSESVEGHSVTYYDLKDEFTPYQDVIENFKLDPAPRRGKVMFL